MSTEKMQIVIEVDGENAKATITGVEEALKNAGDQAEKSSSQIDALNKTLGRMLVFGTVTAGLKSVVDAGLEMDTIMAKLAVGSKNAQNEFDFVSQFADKMGLSVKEAANQYGGLSAAANGTALQGEGVRQIFVGLATAASGLHMNTEQLGGSLLAMQQMISKGKVSAEELNGQLGERLPGAVQIAARAMNMTTEELGKMMQDGKLLAEDFLPKMAEELEKTFGKTAVQTSQNARAAFNRLENSIFDLKTQLASGGILDAIAKLAKGAQFLVENVLKPAVFSVEALGVGFGELAMQAGVFMDFISDPSTWFDDKKKAEFEARLNEYSKIAENERIRITAELAKTGGVVGADSATEIQKPKTKIDPKIAQKIAEEKFKYDEIAKIAESADQKGLERLDSKFEIEMSKMARDRKKAIDAGTWNASVQAEFDKAILAKSQQHEDDKQRILDDSAKRMQIAEFANQQARITNQIAAKMADQSILLSAIESERAVKQAQGVWTLENEDNFQKQKQNIELTALEQTNALKSEQVAFGLANELAALEEKFAKEQELVQGNADAVAQIEATKQQAIVNAQDQAMQKIDAYNQQILAKQQQNANAQLILEANKEKSRQAVLVSSLGMISSLMSNHNEALFRIGQAAAIANVIVNTQAAASKAMAELGAFGFPVAAAIVAGGAAQVATIVETQIGGGAAPAVGGMAGTVPSTIGQAPTPAAQQTQQAPQAQISISVNALSPNDISAATMQQIADSLAPALNQAFSRNSQNVTVMI